MNRRRRDTGIPTKMKCITAVRSMKRLLAKGMTEEWTSDLDEMIRRNRIKPYKKLIEVAVRAYKRELSIWMTTVKYIPPGEAFDIVDEVRLTDQREMYEQLKSLSRSRSRAGIRRKEEEIIRKAAVNRARQHVHNIFANIDQAAYAGMVSDYGTPGTSRRARIPE